MRVFKIMKGSHQDNIWKRIVITIDFVILKLSIEFSFCLLLGQILFCINKI